MANTVGNRGFHDARQAKKDEFYTQLVDIEKELRHYTNHFQDQVVYLNCDDPEVSNFFQYFTMNFSRLGLKKLIATSYVNGNDHGVDHSDTKGAKCIEYTRVDNTEDLPSREQITVRSLTGDGDFRSAESLSILQSADIVVTNPPFSLFREYVAQLTAHQKKFLILGNMNALTYKEIFPLIQDNKMWYGPSIRSGDREFRVPPDYPLDAASTRVDDDGNCFIRVKGVRWFTNLDYEDRHKELPLTKEFREDEYPKYVNFDAIEVGRTADIPFDYQGLMGVPITFIDKYNPDQFEIVGSSKTLGRRMSEIAAKGTFQQGGPRFYLPLPTGGYRRMYDRIVVRNRRLPVERSRGDADIDVLPLSR